MHLSLLSDATFSDLFDDSGRGDHASFKGPVAARQHLNAMVRGAICVAALLTPFALTFAPAAFGHTHTAPVIGEVRP